MTARHPGLFARRLLGLGLALVALAGAATLGAGPARIGDVAAAGLPAWTGGMNVYRDGVFTTQHTWQWCTAADVQIIRNIVDRATDHSRTGQQRYFDFMRRHNRYAIPAADGVDPAGWTAGLREFVDDRYRLTASRSFDAALRTAVTSLRRTGLPVALTVGHGSHAWVLTGFTATADPAATTRFSVTSVRVTGSLWGLQSRTYGYDMTPNKRLTPAQLAGFFTPWHYAGVRMAWEGRWVSVQPTGRTAAAASPPPSIPAISSASSPPSSPLPAVVATASPSPTAATTTGPPASAQPVTSPGPSADPLPAPSGDRRSESSAIVLVGVLLASALVATAARRLAGRRR